MIVKDKHLNVINDNDWVRIYPPNNRFEGVKITQFRSDNREMLSSIMERDENFKNGPFEYLADTNELIVHDAELLTMEEIAFHLFTMDEPKKEESKKPRVKNKFQGQTFHKKPTPKPNTLPSGLFDE